MVEPGDVEREELSDLTVTAEIKGRIPEAATIHFEDKDGAWAAEPMTLEDVFVELVGKKGNGE